MSEVYKIREDYGTLFVRNIDGDFITSDELDNLIARLIYTREMMARPARSQAELQQLAFEFYLSQLMKYSTLHYPLEHPYLEYIPGKVRGPKQPRFHGVYFTSHDYRQDQIKIGYSADIYVRTKGLFHSHNRTPFNVFGYIETEQMEVVEKALHDYFSDYQIEGEWFEAQPIFDWLNEMMEIRS